MLVRAEDKSLAARVQRLEDQEEIRMLLVDYGRSLDARDFVKYASLFAKDGEWSGGFGTAKGPAAIKAMMDKEIGSTPTPRPNSTYHLLTNFAIDVRRYGDGMVALGICGHHQGKYAFHSVWRALRRHGGSRGRPLEVQEARGVERYSAFGKPGAGSKARDQAKTSKGTRRGGGRRGAKSV